jgi:hypothetical protein
MSADWPPRRQSSALFLSDGERWTATPVIGVRIAGRELVGIRFDAEGRAPRFLALSGEEIQSLGTLEELTPNLLAEYFGRAVSVDELLAADAGHEEPPGEPPR